MITDNIKQKLLIYFAILTKRKKKWKKKKRKNNNRRLQLQLADMAFEVLRPKNSYNHSKEIQIIRHMVTGIVCVCVCVVRILTKLLLLLHSCSGDNGTWQ